MDSSLQKNGWKRKRISEKEGQEFCTGATPKDNWCDGEGSCGRRGSDPQQRGGWDQTVKGSRKMEKRTPISSPMISVAFDREV